MYLPNAENTPQITRKSSAIPFEIVMGEGLNHYPINNNVQTYENALLGVENVDNYSKSNESTAIVPDSITIHIKEPSKLGKLKVILQGLPVQEIASDVADVSIEIIKTSGKGLGHVALFSGKVVGGVVYYSVAAVLYVLWGVCSGVFQMVFDVRRDVRTPSGHVRERQKANVHVPVDVSVNVSGNSNVSVPVNISVNVK